MLTLQTLKNNKQHLPRNAAGLRVPIIITGPKRSGKTTAARNLFDDNTPTVTLDPAFLMLEDITPHSPTMSTRVDLSPLFAENIGMDDGLLLVDEAQTASEGVLTALLNIIESGQVFSQPLGKNVMVILIATGETINDPKKSIPMGMLNRAITFNIEADATLR